MTDAKTGTADLLVGTELDVRTIFTFTVAIPDVVSRLTLIQWSNGSTEPASAAELLQVWDRKDPFVDA